jgi:MoaA/NifB/PqqE/SkfB family radical SAM enzyme
VNAPLPKFLQIEPVGQCNLRCRMCPIQSERYAEFRRRLESDDPPEICRGCAVYNGTF